jgi:O-antigen chain-terminating methyltransferase
VLPKPTVTDADLVRLKEDRDRADRLYNEALTALDASVTTPKARPGPGLPPDTTQLDRLNVLWSVVPAEPVPFGGWRARLGAFVWRLVGPMLQRQQEFNAAVVEHLNRGASRDSDAQNALNDLAAAMGGELRALAQMQSRLIAYLQQITLYVDTKDRYETGLLWHEVRLRTDGLAAGLSALGDELLKRREGALADRARIDSRIAELRSRVAEVRHAALEGGARHADRTGYSPAAVSAGGTSSDSPREAETAVAQLAAGDRSETYAGFEDLYRGSPEDIEERLAEYVPLFQGVAGPVLDVGCGRGEFLEALGRNGIAARGVDINASMVERCRARGLDVVQGEALSFLSGLPDGSLGGVFAAQVVEHLLPDEVVRLLDLVLAKLRPGGVAVVETVNAACWAAFFSSYIRDITHVRPVHPDTLRYLLVARGFENVDVRYSSPYPREARMQPLPLTLASDGPAATGIVQVFNQNVDTLNRLMFTHMDYAAVGVKPS